MLQLTSNMTNNKLRHKRQTLDKVLQDHRPLAVERRGPLSPPSRDNTVSKIRFNPFDERKMKSNNQCFDFLLKTYSPNKFASTQSNFKFKHKPREKDGWRN